MNILLKVILAILVFLAVSSGIAKVMLTEQDVGFLTRYGFSNPMIIAFGIAHIIGGCLLILPRTRMIGAIVVAITFLISLVMLVMDGNMMFSAFTIVALILLGFVVKQTKTGGRRTRDY